MRYTKEEVISKYKELSYDDFTNWLLDIKGCSECPFSKECSEYTTYESGSFCDDIIRDIIEREENNMNNNKEVATAKNEETVDVLLQESENNMTFLILTKNQYNLLNWLRDNDLLSDNVNFNEVDNIDKINLTKSI